ncbi:MAG: sensor domain-containing diguanylate cyclase [Nitrospirota bacterium]
MILFDIQIVISRTLTVIFLLIGAIGTHVGLFKFFEPVTGSIAAILLSLSVIAWIFFKTPARKTLQAAMNDIILRDKYGYQEILRESAKAVTTILDPDELLNYLVNTIRKSLKAGNICIFIRGEDGRYHIRSSCGINKKTASNFKIDNGIISWLILTKQIFVREEQELSRDPEGFKAIYQDLGAIDAEIIIPMFYKGDLLGILTLGYKGSKDMYVQSDMDILEALAGQAAIAIENARLSEEAITDGLTGLYCHKYFQIRLHEELERARRYGHPLSLLMIDVDYFKMVNDEHGHLAGDKVLREVARAWKEKIRLGDILARYGGEEFALILPETSAPDALKIAENLRALTEGKRVDGIRITISIGISFFDGKKSDFDRGWLIRCADKALYRSKNKGRNRIELVN